MVKNMGTGLLVPHMKGRTPALAPRATMRAPGGERITFPPEQKQCPFTLGQLID